MQHLRRRIRQLTKASKNFCLFLLVLLQAYLLDSWHALYALEPSDFDNLEPYWTQTYMDQLY